MKYYTRRKKYKYIPYLIVVIVIFIVFNTVLVFYDRTILPSVRDVAETMIRAKAVDEINQTSINLLSDEFRYDQMIKIEKDNEGNIILMQADTVKLNYISSQMALKCNERLRSLSETSIRVPLGWVTNKSVFYNLGPKIPVKIEPIGNVVTSYESKFESAGINQTRHKIYINVKAAVRMKLPAEDNEVEVTTQVPVSETIIIGKIPDTTLGFGNTNTTSN